MATVVPHRSPGNGESAGERLESWKEIAGYLRRDVRTVQRWEKRELLPVHRHLHDKLGTVYAYKTELDGWWSRRQPQLQKPATFNSRRLLWVLAAAGFAVAALLLAMRSSRSVPPSQVVTRRVWEGPDVFGIGAISPDGRYLACSDAGTSDLALLEVATGQQRRLTHKPPKARVGGVRSPVFSRDGKQIAYGWDLAYFYELRVVGIDGTGDRLVYRNEDVVQVWPAGWSPDGARILASLLLVDGTRQIVVIGIEDGAVKFVKRLDSREPQGLSFSPEGRFIAYDLPAREGAPERDLFLLNPSSGDVPIPLVEHPGDDFLLGWTPDGKTVLFASDRSGTLDAWAIDISGARAQGSPRPVKKAIGRVHPLGFTRSGAYYYILPASGAVDVYIVDLDPVTGRPSNAPAAAALRFLGSNRFPDWSPDGRFLAHVPRTEKPFSLMQPKIVIRSLDSREQRELTPNLNYVEAIRWSPRGQSILAVASDLENRPALFEVDAKTGNTKTVVTSTDPRRGFHEPMWSGDGKLIYYKLRDAGLEPSRLIVHEIATGGEKELLASVYRYDLSPDGGSLAFSTFDEQAEYIRIMPARGGEGRQVFSQPRGVGRIYSVAWTRDGQHLLFARKGDLWRIPVTGGSPENLGLHMEALRDLRIHPDGTRLAFTAGTSKGEVWAMENFLGH